MKKSAKKRKPASIAVHTTPDVLAVIKDHCAATGEPSVSRFLLSSALTAAGRADIVESLPKWGRPKKSN